jgi:predicted nucleic acid-binding protein
MGHRLAAARIGETRGRPVDIKDTLMAGMAATRNAAIPSRNVRHLKVFQSK